MDVHDCGSYVEPGEVGRCSFERKDPLSGGDHQPPQPHPAALSMVLTIEPGIYAPAEGCARQFHHRHPHRRRCHRHRGGLASELITRGVPVKADEIEAMRA